MSKIYLTKFKQIGKRVGSFYTSFFIGIIAGYALAVTLLIPLMGLIRTLITLAFITFVLATIILFKAQRYTLVSKALLAGPLHVIILLFYLFFPSFDNYNNPENGKLIERTGNNNVYSVVQNDSHNGMNLEVNGHVLSGNHKCFKIGQRLLGNIPMLLCKYPQRIFVSGFGTGEVISTIKNYEIDHIDCCEPSGEIIHLSKYFSRIYYNVQSDQQVNIITNHSDTYLHLTQKQYDVMVLNYLHPERHRNFIYYTKEYFDDCAKNLNPGGIVALNIYLQRIALDKFQVLLKTFNSTFEHTSLWFNNNDYSYHIILIGTKDDKYKIDFKILYDRLQREAVQENLAEIKLFDVYEVLDCYICGPNSMNQLIEESKPNRLYRPYYRLAQFTADDEQSDINQYLTLFKKVKEPVTYLLDNIESPEEEEDVIKLILNMYYKSSRYVFDGLIFEHYRNIPQALHAFRLGYQVNKLDNGAKRFIDAYYNPKLIPDPQTPEELTENAKIYYQKMEYQKAIEVLKKAIDLDRRYAPAYFGLGINYEVLNDTYMAMRMYRATLRLKPRLTQARERLNNLIKQRKEFEKQFKRGIFNKAN
ncbi:tetratricopeptide repeat protein [candidate division KSB1 bacterium]|nr:tetratricopeptide repeat protein [candidate division KSB1 bacterium]